MLSSAAKKAKLDHCDGSSLNSIGLQNKIGEKIRISFNHNFQKKDVRLIEVTEDLLKLLERGESLSIIGPIEVSGSGSSSTSDAVLTSQEKTFSIKKVEQSNAVYIVDPSNTDEYSIQFASQDYYEIKPIPARLEKIKQLLSSTQYNGTDVERESLVDESKLMSYNELRDQVQASNVEFTLALFGLGVVELQGKMRLLSKLAIREAVQQLIYTIMENAWDIHSISEEKCVLAMHTVDPVLLNFALKTLVQKKCLKEINSHSSTDENEGKTGFWNLDQDSISKATAHILFNSQTHPTKPWGCEDFLRTWESETPGIDKPKESLILQGIAIKIESQCHKSISSDGSDIIFHYRYLPLEDLSLDFQTRLNQLFAVRAKYREEELQPYFLDMISSIGGKPKSIPELLLSHTRLIDEFYMSK